MSEYGLNHPPDEEEAEPGIEDAICAKIRERAITGVDDETAIDTTDQVVQARAIAGALLDHHGLVGGALLAGALLATISDGASTLRDAAMDQPDDESDTIISDLIFLSGVIDTADAGSALVRVIFGRLLARAHDRAMSAHETAAPEK